jgi:hypothetical protein
MGTRVHRRLVQAEADKIHEDDCAYNRNPSNQIIRGQPVTVPLVQRKYIPQFPIQLPASNSDRKNSANPVSMEAENAAKKDIALE